jgi:anti-sigma28 factor (negative regulator of flagellin synthesis)
MLGIERIDNTGQVQSPREARGQGKTAEAKRLADGDGVLISAEAREAAEAARFVSLTGDESALREAAIQAAREQIAQGRYKDPSVVDGLAERLLSAFG